MWTAGPSCTDAALTLMHALKPDMLTLTLRCRQPLHAPALGAKIL